MSKDKLPAAAGITLDSLICKDDLKAVVEYQHGLKFHLKFVNRGELQRLSRTCLEWDWDKASKQRVQRVNNDKFVEAFCKLSVTGWEGATVETLSKFVPISKKGLSDEKLKQEVPFSQENLVALMKNSLDLDEFLQKVATDFTVFDPSMSEETLGNSETSPSGS